MEQAWVKSVRFGAWTVSLLEAVVDGASTKRSNLKYSDECKGTRPVVESVGDDRRIRAIGE